MMARLDRNPIRVEIYKQLMASSDWSHSIEVWNNTGEMMPLSISRSITHMRRAKFCMAPTGDSDGFTARLYSILISACIPVRVDTYYPNHRYRDVAWPFKKTLDWRRAVVLVTPSQLRRVGIVQTLRAISTTRSRQMRRYIKNVVQPTLLYDPSGGGPDAFSAFLKELIHLAHRKLPLLDRSNASSSASSASSASLSIASPSMTAQRRE